MKFETNSEFPTENEKLEDYVFFWDDGKISVAMFASGSEWVTLLMP